VAALCCTGAPYHNDWRALLQLTMQYSVDKWHSVILPDFDNDQLRAEFSVDNLRQQLPLVH